MARSPDPAHRSARSIARLLSCSIAWLIVALSACTGGAASVQTPAASSDATHTTHTNSNEWCVKPPPSQHELAPEATAAIGRIPPMRWASLPHGAEWTFTLSDTMLARTQTARICKIFRNPTSDSTTVALAMEPDDVEVVVKNARGLTVWRQDSGVVSNLMISTYRLAPHGVLLFPQHLPPSWGGPVELAWRSLPPGRYAVYVALQMAPDSLVLAEGPPPIDIELR